MFSFRFRCHAATLAVCAIALSSPTFAHGAVGSRFFPATIASDDPFAADELTLPTISLGSHEEDYAFEYSKSIVPDVSLSIGGGETTGTINPGLIWSGRYTQLAAEAIIPVNNASGDNVGLMMQLHFYMDDVFPHSLGTPLFGGTP